MIPVLYRYLLAVLIGMVEMSLAVFIIYSGGEDDSAFWWIMVPLVFLIIDGLVLVGFGVLV